MKNNIFNIYLAESLCDTSRSPICPERRPNFDSKTTKNVRLNTFLHFLFLRSFHFLQMIRSQIISDHSFEVLSWPDIEPNNRKLYFVLYIDTLLSFQIDLFRIKITNNNEIVLNSEFLDAKFFNEMQAQSARCRIIRFMSNRDYLGCKTNYQWD